MAKQFILFLLLLGLSASCHPMQKTVKNDTEKIITITVRNPKVEIAGQFENMASLYEKSHPLVRIQTETVGGISDDFSDLKTQMAIGQGPDIFTNVGYAATGEWLDYLVDLSEESWVGDARPDTLAPVTVEGKVYGMPMNIEGFGVIYNKELFRKAGVDQPPKTFKELEAAAQKLNQYGVTPFANGYYEEWKLGHHLTSLAFAEQSNPEAFIESLSDNRTSFTDSDSFRNLLRFVDLTLTYGNPHAATADYYTEMDAFRSGEAAMVVQGNWVEPLLENQVPKLEVGMFPIPLDNDGDAQLVTGVPSYWVVNKQSGEAEIREAKRFLRWMAESAEGRRFQTERLHFIPAFQTIDPPKTGLSGSVWKQYKQQERQSFNWSSYSPPLKEAFGQVFKRYVNEEKSKRDTLQDLDHAWRQHVSSK
ncbi:carbohydrate ABC transporter substrate-binding protein, CUT1 family [Terribacillus aidingensis]|uniref:Carbohydrate ABC transporter substrate-binding protein, CUT1 family n=1 Tax=Terribacillus aidingensis TaxID=586416 RepID=A0A285N6D6_9BACI|nr:extracellular solute-binding protein [Terribacillus aidingensis]SNZ03271.1 carbohydrate ABC transporter substrate-binding protein, CUT1 family [Terribacillus aidingensis]